MKFWRRLISLLALVYYVNIGQKVSFFTKHFIHNQVWNIRLIITEQYSIHASFSCKLVQFKERSRYTIITRESVCSFSYEQFFVWNNYPIHHLDIVINNVISKAKHLYNHLNYISLQMIVCSNFLKKSLLFFVQISNIEYKLRNDSLHLLLYVCLTIWFVLLCFHRYIDKSPKEINILTNKLLFQIKLTSLNKVVS